MRTKPRDEKVDEIVQSIWMLKEYGKSSVEDLIEFSDEEQVAEELGRMAEESLIRFLDGSVELMPLGHRRAEDLVRRHRLAEWLLTQVLGLDKASSDSSACQFEHILSPTVTDSICTLLGHPPICPDGKPIPPGPCCRTLQRVAKPIVVRLCDLGVGQSGKVTFITPSLHSRFDLLASQGIVPGTVVHLHQKIPAYVIQTGETELAIDKAITEEIYVQKL